jgi:probable rRNA maturation factor
MGARAQRPCRSKVNRQRRKRGPGFKNGAPRGREVIGGEIVLSAETAWRNAGTYGVSPQDELSLYVVHGLLHLCGYDDLTPREKRIMRRREAEALAGSGVAPSS